MFKARYIYQYIDNVLLENVATDFASARVRNGSRRDPRVSRCMALKLLHVHWRLVCA